MDIMYEIKKTETKKISSKKDLTYYLERLSLYCVFFLHFFVVFIENCEGNDDFLLLFQNLIKTCELIFLRVKNSKGYE